MEEMTNNEIEQKEIESVTLYAHSNPEALPEQFGGDPKKFIDSYKELRKTLTKAQQDLANERKNKTVAQPLESQQSTEDAPPLSVPQTPQTPQQPSQEEWNKWGQELRTQGTITPESREQIKKKYNLPDQMIDEYIQGVHARAKQTSQQAAELVGGTESLKTIMKWASEKLTDAERAMVNDQLSTSNWQTTLLGLQARMNKESPNPTMNEPKTQFNKVNAPSSPDITPFANRKEMTWAIRDKRYGVDSKYTQFVQERIRISGTNRDGI